MLNLDEAIEAFVASVMAFVEAVLYYSLWPIFWLFGIEIDLTP